VGVSANSRPSRLRPARDTLRCEIDGLPAELDRAELSAAGAFVVTTQPSSVDSEVSIFLRIAEQRFDLSGHVVTSVTWEQAAQSGKKPGFALLFTNLSDADRKRLASAIRSARGPSAPPRVSAQPKAAVTSKAAPARASVVEKPAKPTYTAAELDLLAQLKKQLAHVEEQTAWAVLGVSQGADPDRVKAAFFDASKRYHPHLFARYAHPEIKRVVTELFIAHKRAFTTMTKLSKKP
jgi:hypothetical protein